jgi:hypothetical protein
MVQKSLYVVVAACLYLNQEFHLIVHEYINGLYFESMWWRMLTVDKEGVEQLLLRVYRRT